MQVAQNMEKGVFQVLLVMTRQKMSFKALSQWFPTSGITSQVYVVYFNQRMHACACNRMVENNEKRSKIMKKVH